MLKLARDLQLAVRLTCRYSQTASNSISTEAATQASASVASSAPKVVSSVPAGTRLKGCNARKNGEDPIALPDDEYPSWLWEVLDPEAQARKLEANPIALARKQRREANRKRIKQRNFLAKMGN